MMYNEILTILKNLNIIKGDNRINSNLKIILDKNQNIREQLRTCTSFLDNIVTDKQRIYTIKEDIRTQPLCNNDECNNVVKFKQKYNLYCSNKCLGLDKKIQNKKAQTCLERFGVDNPSKVVAFKSKKKETTMRNHGVENPFQSDIIKNKIKNHNIEKYGVEYFVQSDDFKQKFNSVMNERYNVDHALQSEEILKKSKQTCLKNHGVEYPLQSNVIKEIAKGTCLKNHGVEHSMQSPEIKKKSKQTCLNNYGVEYPMQSLEIQESVRSTCLKVYGVEYPMQSPEIQEKTKATCLKLYGVEYPMQRSIPLDKLRNMEWLYEQHMVQKKPLVQIANDLNVSDITVGNYLHSHGLETQNYFQSLGERSVNDFILSLDIKTLTNTRSIISPYELDIYIPEHAIAIEYNGLYWHSEQAGKNKNYHKKKYDLCKNKGIQLITIFEDEWIQRQEHVKSKIKSLLLCDDREKVYARKTKVVTVFKHLKKEFLENNHIQGDDRSSIEIGLEYTDRLVACMTFRKRSDGIYELSRYATSARVVGGFSKLFKYFCNVYNFNKVISFADLRWSTGKMYTVNGWVIDGIIPPDYSYSPDAVNRFHKFNFRRKNLSNLLVEYNPKLTERENCDNNKILRIWDCGKIRFVYNS